MQLGGREVRTFRRRNGFAVITQFNFMEPIFLVFPLFLQEKTV
jgi:hypothetical protein